jgi:endonuclease/exonuclease/phosphatase family metal-dependent hydrolase
MNTCILCLVAVLMSATASRAQWLRTIHDGFTDEWTGWPVLAVDPAGDHAVDLQLLQAARDETSLTFRLRLGTEFLLQESNTLRMLLDTDCNPATGTSVEGLGAELVWTFGSRSGTYRQGATTITVRHQHLGLRTLPTHSSTDYEITLDLAALPDGTHPLFPLDSLRAVFQVPSGDRLPAAGHATVQIGSGSLPALPNTPLPRTGDGTLRVAAWNVLFGSLFDTGLTASYDRLLTALAPDIIAFEEVWDQSAAQTVTRLNQLVPELGPWTAVKRDVGNIIAARFPIRTSWLVQSGYRESAALIDASAVLGDSLLFVACHLRASGANAERQQEADGLIKFLHDARNPGGAITLRAGTPIVLAGDFNLVGDRQQLTTLLTGDIVDNATYGPDSPPDWDGSDLADLVPRFANRPEVATWWNNSSTYLPGRLDFILTTDSVLEAVRSGVVATPFLGDSLLAAWNLEAGDSWSASDHFIVWADLRLPQSSVEAPQLHIQRQADASLLLSWEAVSGAAAYRVEQAWTLGAPWMEVGVVTGTALVLPPPGQTDQRLFRAIALR